MLTFGDVLIDVWVPRSHCIVCGAIIPQWGRAAATGAVAIEAIPTAPNATAKPTR
jgi:hypothetical protein